MTPSDNMDVEMSHWLQEYENALEEQQEEIVKKYGPAKVQQRYLYKDLLDTLTEKPTLVLLDVQFVGKQLSEIAIIHENLQFIFARNYPTCRNIKDKFVYHISYNNHNYRKASNASGVQKNNLLYVNQICPCNGQNPHHQRVIFNDTNFFRQLPHGENVVYVIRGQNKKEFVERFMKSFDIQSYIRTFPLPLSTKGDDYITCPAHVSSDSHCSVANLCQMMRYYNICVNLINDE